MEKRSIWDNYVYGYEEYHSDTTEKEYTVRLYTHYKVLHLVEYTDVTFEQVVAHHFAHVLRGAKLNEVVEESVDVFLGQRRGEWNKLPTYDFIKQKLNRKELAQYREDEGLRAFTVKADHGMLGWAFARRFVATARAERKQFGLER